MSFDQGGTSHQSPRVLAASASSRLRVWCWWLRWCRRRLLKLATNLLAVNRERLPATGPETVDREIGVKGNCVADTETVHDRPTCAVDEGEPLVSK